MAIFRKSMNRIKSSRFYNDTAQFMRSNSMISNLAFILLVLIVFLLMLRLGINLVAWILTPSGNVHLIDGMIDAKHGKHFPQDPNAKGAKPILRSVDQRFGMEFTWSVWIYIEDLQYGQHKYKHIFHKGNDQVNYSDTPTTSSGLNAPNNGPGLYIAPDTNDLIVIMNTFENMDEKMTVKDIPLNKWVNIMIRCENIYVDVYVNGTIVNSHKCKGVPKQNYGDVFTTLNGGFSGYLSNLWYWNRALSSSQIKTIVRNGPDLSMKNNKDMTAVKPAYFSLRWFFSSPNEDYGGL